jgi:hypothetical protein
MQLAAFATLLEDALANSNVKGKCYEDDYPDGRVEYCDTEDVPFKRNPTPHLRRVSKEATTVTKY